MRKETDQSHVLTILPPPADIDMAVVGTHVAHTTAKLAMEGEYTQARMNALVSQRLMQRQR